MSVKIKSGQKPTEEQIQQIQEATKKPIIFDEDSPEYSYEQLVRFREAARKKRGEEYVTVSLSKPTFKKAKELGSGYRQILSNLLDLALSDPEMIKRASSSKG